MHLAVAHDHLIKAKSKLLCVETGGGMYGGHALCGKLYGVHFRAPLVICSRVDLASLVEGTGGENLDIKGHIATIPPLCLFWQQPHVYGNEHTHMAAVPTRWRCTQKRHSADVEVDRC
ncbi:Hypothetical predicted protein [Xyrichtys novacula]|uniref:Uncharacterized protein n=1 Tax=Xyrichtys novacula TaxID=13765 RepID=A0AAV1GSQ9_XYRNO|nr:Hypothetical predicted protein [Xyrichtys novacula]